MTLSEFSIRRPIFTWMVTLVVIIIGLVSLSRLPVEKYAAGYQAMRDAMQRGKKKTASSAKTKASARKS